MRVVPLDRPWEGHQLLWDFDFFILILSIWKESKFWAVNTKMHLILLLVWTTVCICAQAVIFYRRTVLQKCGRGQQLVFGLRLVSRMFEDNQQYEIQTKIEHYFGWFFQQIKVRQPIGRKDSKQTVIPTSSRLDSLLHEVAQNFELFSNIQDQN